MIYLHTLLIVALIVSLIIKTFKIKELKDEIKHYKKIQKNDMKIKNINEELIFLNKEIIQSQNKIISYYKESEKILSDIKLCDEFIIKSQKETIELLEKFNKQ